ncbi:16472_t:CDS:2, partial [Funneliformis mosseae]
CVDVDQMWTGNNVIVVTEDGKLWKLNLKNNEEPNEIRLSDESDNLNTFFVNVVCGENHCLALTKDGEVYSWGSGRFGQLGHGELTDSLEKPMVIEFFQGLRVKKISCGGWHSAVITDSDDLYTFGWNHFGRLGIFFEESSTVNCAEPSLVEFFGEDNEELNVLKVACGSAHTVVITDDFRLWSCGWGKYGQLGLGADKLNDNYKFVPIDSTDLRDKKVLNCSCGRWNTFLISLFCLKYYSLSTLASSYSFFSKQIKTTKIFFYIPKDSDMVLRGERGCFPQFCGRGKSPINDRNRNSQQTSENNDPQTSSSVVTDTTTINNLREEVDIIVEEPSVAPPTPSSLTSTTPASVDQQHQPAQQSRRIIIKPLWDIEDEIELVNYVCDNYELLSNNRKLFWREFSKECRQILLYPKSIYSCKSKFYALVAHHQNVDLYDAIERYLDLKEETSSFSFQKKSLRPAAVAASSNKPPANILLPKASGELTRSTSSQAVVLAKTSLETNKVADPNPREISLSVSPQHNISSEDDDRRSGTTSPTNNSYPPIQESVFDILPADISQSAVSNYDNHAASLTTVPSTSYNDFTFYIENIRQQIFAAQDYLIREKSRAEDRIDSFNQVHHLFIQLENQLQKMMMKEL